MPPLFSRGNFCKSLDFILSTLLPATFTYGKTRISTRPICSIYIQSPAPVSILSCMYIIYSSIHTHTIHIIFLVEFLHICARLTYFVQEYVWLMIFYSIDACVPVCMSERANYMIACSSCE